MDQANFVRAVTHAAPGTICFMAPNALDALSIIRDNTIIPDYIFVDLMMPGLNAIEFLRLIKQISVLKDIPVVVHANQPVPDRLVDLKQAGAFAIHFRPYDHRGILNFLSLYFHNDKTRVLMN
ncbi:response regulator [Chryseolinea lacunae]|uniref:Response regulator n=1 Tax=Chryseolinea lacunae TaxID=2801331 RepID=A0ABS1KY73_9BACT|nr:response regulator [Chryseolinea lacunae]MBL0744192.1 response regulator [Chryseolinea lacunae]